MHVRRLAPAVLAAFTGGSGMVSVAAAQCTINFDQGCPNVSAQCGATFQGGVGCIFAGLGLCYDTGTRAYRVTAATSPLLVTIPTGISDISVFLAQTGGAQGSMRFFDGVTGGVELGTPLGPNGDCSTVMPPQQSRAFPRAVHRIEVSVTGPGSFWIDTMTTTTSAVSVDRSSWGVVKALYR